MDLQATDKKLKEALEEMNWAKRYYGAQVAKKLHLRRDALAAADSLADFWPPNSRPERVHELVANLAGLFSIDLQHPFRLLFYPIECIVHDDALTRWKSIKKIELVRVEDTHG